APPGRGTPGWPPAAALRPDTASRTPLRSASRGSRRFRAAAATAACRRRTRSSTSAAPAEMRRAADDRDGYRTRCAPARTASQREWPRQLCALLHRGRARDRAPARVLAVPETPPDGVVSGSLL